MAATDLRASAISSLCDMGHLEARLAAANVACCLGLTGQQAQCAAICSLDCATVLVPLMNDCRPVISALYDSLDGNENGLASRFDTVYSACTAGIASGDVIRRLHTLVQTGACSMSDLDGFAQTQVSRSCEDSLPNCGQLISMGLPCISLHVGWCDSTCGYCALGGGGHRRQLLLALFSRLQTSTIRRAQTTECVLADMQDDINRINSACCDQACSGVPTTCDAKCAVFFVDFYDRCQAFLAPTLGASAAVSMSELYATCSQDLPTTVLLDLVDRCSPVPPTVTSILANTFGENCDVGTLEARITSLNAACWPMGTATECTLPCGMELIPLLDECEGMLEALYDSADGSEDGIATILTTQRSSCSAMPLADVMQHVEHLHDSGRCPNEALDSVAETEVVSTCEDTNPSCEMIISTGLSCSNLVGACDATCGACGASVIGGRRTQDAECDLSSLQSDINRINCLCCDTIGSCQNGVPSTCDAKCAIFFVDFFDRCQSYINVQVDTASARALSELAHTCEQQLPVEPLIRIAAECTAGWVPQSSTYQEPLAGWCSGPAGIGAINGRSKYNVPSKAECEAECDAEATCIGYAYAARIDGENGCCSIYGPGVSATGAWVAHTDGHYPLLFHGDGGHRWPELGIPATPMDGAVFSMIVPYNSNSLITSVDDAVVETQGNIHHFITDGVCVTKFGLSVPPPPCDVFRNVCRDGTTSDIDCSSGYCNGPGGADDAVEARRIAGWTLRNTERCLAACTDEPACMGVDFGYDPSVKITFSQFCRNFGPGMRGYTYQGDSQTLVLDHLDSRWDNVAQDPDLCEVAQGCYWTPGYAGATQGIIAGVHSHPTQRSDDGTCESGLHGADCAVCKVKHCPCDGVMCLNGGVCRVNTQERAVCVCAVGFRGEWCEVGARRLLQGTPDWCSRVEPPPPPARVGVLSISLSLSLSLSLCVCVCVSIYTYLSRCLSPRFQSFR